MFIFERERDRDRERVSKHEEGRSREGTEDIKWSLC